MKLRSSYTINPNIKHLAHCRIEAQKENKERTHYKIRKIIEKFKIIEENLPLNVFYEIYWIELLNIPSNSQIFARYCLLLLAYSLF